MKTAIYTGILFISGILLGCSSGKDLVVSPMFIAATQLPAKPSFENNPVFASFYHDYYRTEPETPNMIQVNTQFVKSIEKCTNLSYHPLYLTGFFFLNYEYSTPLSPFNNWCFFDEFYTNYSLINSHSFGLFCELHSPYYWQQTDFYIWHSFNCGWCLHTAFSHNFSQSIPFVAGTYHYWNRTILKNFQNVYPVKDSKPKSSSNSMISSNPSRHEKTNKTLFVKPFCKNNKLQLRATNSIREIYVSSQSYSYTKRQTVRELKGTYQPPTNTGTSDSYSVYTRFSKSDQTKTSITPKTFRSNGSSPNNRVSTTKSGHQNSIRSNSNSPRPVQKNGLPAKRN